MALFFLNSVGVALAQEPTDEEIEAAKREAQANPLAPIDTSSPYTTLSGLEDHTEILISVFQGYNNDRTFDNQLAVVRQLRRFVRLFDLRDVSPATRTEVALASCGYLWDILARLPHFEMAAVPGAPGLDQEAELPERWRIPNTEIDIVRIDDGPRSGEFLFSAETVASLPEFHALIIDRPRLRPTLVESWRDEQVKFTGPVFPAGFADSLPPILQVEMLGTPAWKFILTIAMLAAIVGAVAIWAIAVARLSTRVGRLTTLVLKITVPALLAVLIWQAHWFWDWQVNVSGLFATVTSIVSSVLLYASAAYAAWCACFLLVEAIIASPTIPDESYDANLLRLIAQVAAAVAAAAVAVYGANDIGIPALGLFAGLGIGGLALALAAQPTIENLFGGVSLFADRPFRVGDLIRLPEGDGTVETVGPRSSRVRHLDRTLTTIPNAELAKMNILNYSRRDKYHFFHRLGVRYETSADQLRTLVDSIRELLLQHPATDIDSNFPNVSLVGFGDSSINIEIRAYLRAPGYFQFLSIQQDLMLDLMALVEDAGSGFAFPSQTVYLSRDGGLPTNSDIGSADVVTDPGINGR